MNGPLGLTAATALQNLQEVKERGQMESDLARVSEAAAGMFEGLGFPEAQSFAQQLRSDPVGAGMMAKSFGGFQNLYGALQKQQAARQATEMSQNLEERVGASPEAAEGSPALRMQLMRMGYDPNKILGPAAAREGPDVMDRAMKIGAMRFRELGPALNSRMGMERVGAQLDAARESNNPVAAFAAIRQFIQSLDNSVVRGEEFRSFMESIGIAEGLASQWATATGDLARSRLAAQTKEAAGQALRELDKAIGRRDQRFQRLAQFGQVPWDLIGGMNAPPPQAPAVAGGEEAPTGAEAAPTLPVRPGQRGPQPRVLSVERLDGG